MNDTIHQLEFDVDPTTQHVELEGAEEGDLEEVTDIESIYFATSDRSLTEFDRLYKEGTLILESRLATRIRMDIKTCIASH